MLRVLCIGRHLLIYESKEPGPRRALPYEQPD